MQNELNITIWSQERMCQTESLESHKCDVSETAEYVCGKYHFGMRRIFFPHVISMCLLMDYAFMIISHELLSLSLSLLTIKVKEDDHQCQRFSEAWYSVYQLDWYLDRLLLEYLSTESMDWRHRLVKWFIWKNRKWCETEHSRSGQRGQNEIRETPREPHHHLAVIMILVLVQHSCPVKKERITCTRPEDDKKNIRRTSKEVQRR